MWAAFNVYCTPFVDGVNWVFKATVLLRSAPPVYPALAVKVGEPIGMSVKLDETRLRFATAAVGASPGAHKASRVAHTVSVTMPQIMVS
jgi:hypothetical protein